MIATRRLTRLAAEDLFRAGRNDAFVAAALGITDRHVRRFRQRWRRETQRAIESTRAYADYLRALET